MKLSVIDLAIILASSTEYGPFPANKLELFRLFNAKEQRFQDAYIRRARRLLKAVSR